MGSDNHRPDFVIWTPRTKIRDLGGDKQFIVSMEIIIVLIMLFYRWHRTQRPARPGRRRPSPAVYKSSHT
eukprot:g36349.t1